MSCCAGCDTGMGCMGHLMGAIEQRLPPIAGGGPFQFGFNTGYFRGELYKPEDIAAVLENAGLTYDTHSYYVAGSVNPYLTIEGNAVTTWSSGSDFGQAIYDAVSGAGFPIDYASIQFRFEPAPAAGQPTSKPPAFVGTPYPTGTPRSQSIPQAPGGGCSFSQQNLPDYLACQLGVTPTVALVAGAIGALILVAVVKR